MGGWRELNIPSICPPTGSLLQLLRNNLRNHCSEDSFCSKGQTYPISKGHGQSETEVAHGLFSVLWPWSPYNMAEAPTPLDAYTLLLLLIAVALAVGAHPSRVDLPYPFICFSANLSNIFIA